MVAEVVEVVLENHINTFTPAHTYRPFLQSPNPKPHHHYCPTNYTLKFYFFFFILSAPPLARLAPHHQPHRLQKPFDSRLARNSNRVNSLNAKLQLKLSNIHKCDLRPVETEIRPEDLSTPIISSVSQGSSECFARIGVSTPANQCEPCSDCYQETNPIFQPNHHLLTVLSPPIHANALPSKRPPVETTGCLW
ncbi:hypothetical protein G4B88_008823 [Cannabis sativa]|uniref:Uncharacterized protein n=1 Tax=Cannabis sativa TaxID=3483 RepID=A0A7J6DMK1_CANSA|nr:hypothetical protein G4B88_008823 [Cannabis sativa]